MSTPDIYAFLNANNMNDITPLQIVTKWVMFGYNYNELGGAPEDWIKKIWGDTWMAQHLIGKFNEAYEYCGSRGAMNYWFSELDGTNRRILVDYFMEHYVNRNGKEKMQDKTNLQMLLWGVEHIADNHGLQSSTGGWADEGQICIFGGCNIPTLADVKMLCQDVCIPDDCICSSEFGIDIDIPEDWYESVGRSPFSGDGLWAKYNNL